MLVLIPVVSRIILAVIISVVAVIIIQIIALFVIISVVFLPIIMIVISSSILAVIPVVIQLRRRIACNGGGIRPGYCNSGAPINTSVAIRSMSSFVFIAPLNRRPAGGIR